MSTLAVVSQSGESLSFFDASGQLTGRLTDLPAEPHELCYDDRTNLLYISHAYRHGWYTDHGDFSTEISVVDCSQRKVVETIDVSPAGGTHCLALDKQRDILYSSVEHGLSTSPNAGGIVGIDLKTRKVVKSIESGHKTHWFVMTTDGQKAFTCNKEAEFISVIDLLSEKMIGKIEIPGGCEQPDISKDGKLAYFPTPCLANAASDPTAKFSVKVIDVASARIIDTIPLDMGAVSVHVDTRSRILLGQFSMSFSDAGKPITKDGGLTVLSSAAEGHRRMGTVSTGEVPLTVFSSPDGKALLANIFKGTVSIIDLGTMKLEKTLEVDTVQRKDKSFHAGAHGMAFIP